MCSIQAWRGTLARWRCRRLRAIYTIMRWFRRHKVRAHLMELQRRFQAARQPPLYGRDLVWPTPPAVLQPFQDTCHVLFSRYHPQPTIQFPSQPVPFEYLSLTGRHITELPPLSSRKIGLSDINWPSMYHNCPGTELGQCHGLHKGNWLVKTGK